MPIELQSSFDPLKQQLLAAAESFSEDAKALHGILTGLVNDVERAVREPLEIFPVCHHSPSSAVQMVRRLRTRPPRVIYMECCEDLQSEIGGLRDCKLPVALQAFAPKSKAFPASWAPLNLVCPLTELSAEFQAIAYTLEHPTTELVFVDRSCDHVFQWMPQEDHAIEQVMPSQLTPDEMDGDAGLHGTAVGIEVGSLVPTFEKFHETLVLNARVQHFSEWWDQYVEEAILGSDYATYQQVMFLIGSLFRRLGTRDADKRTDELRERYMWTRIKEHLARSNTDPRDAIYVCGAAHAASYVEEFGIEKDTRWEIPPRTDTEWLYGLLPSSYTAIEYQFSHSPGTVTLAENRWKKGLAQNKLKPFALTPSRKSSKKSEASEESEQALDGKKASKSKKLSKLEEGPAHEATSIPVGDGLGKWLSKPPNLIDEDETELLQNCVKIVDLARRNGYMASTADAIAVYQTSILLANLRSRRHPTSYDFRDAAVTCIEKDSVPGKRTVTQLCNILLGGDKVGQVGYESMPPLAQNLYDRLRPLPIQLEARTIQRALLDFRKNPEYASCSDILWKLRYLLDDVVRPIMGQRSLGHIPQQESWDIAIGKNQGLVLQLGYEGITIEHVIERRLKKAAFGADSRTLDALTAAEDCILYLESERLAEELGDRSIELLVKEPDVQDAREIYKRITRLIHYYRSREGGLPSWCQRFVTTGYSHYAALLPEAFQSRGVAPSDLAAMLQFIFTLEGLALSLGCSRNQLVVAIRQSEPEAHDFTKLAMLWSTECLLQIREMKSVRAKLDEVLENERSLFALPDYLSGFLLSLSFTPQVTHLTVELMSKCFARLPDRVLMPWLPRLLMMLREHATTSLPSLLKEAVACFPSSIAQLEGWTPPWSPANEASDRSEAESISNEYAPAHPSSQPPGDPAVIEFLAKYPATTNALATALNLDPS